MHEFTIALNVIDIAKEYSRKANSEKVLEIEIEVGEVSGIVYEALEFALNSATKNTLLEQANKKIIRIHGKAVCNKCQHSFPLDNIYGECPSCNSFDFQIVHGKELRVKSILFE
ncbi:hydrogenase maturation nickel metallochaperone HypA [Bacteroidota bacterium]